MIKSFNSETIILTVTELFDFAFMNETIWVSVSESEDFSDGDEVFEGIGRELSNETGDLESVRGGDCEEARIAFRRCFSISLTT